MSRQWFALAATLTVMAAACATSERDSFGGRGAPPPSTEQPTFPAAGDGCTCSEDGRTVLCEGAAPTPCADGQRCFDGRCIEDACIAARSKQSTEGCSFYTVVPDAYDGAQGCYAIFLTNASPRPVELTLHIEGRELHGSEFAYIPSGSGDDIRYDKLPDGRIPENGLAIAFIAGPGTLGGQGSLRPCPATPAVTHTKATPRELGFVPAIMLETSEPVVASDIYPYGGADSHVTAASVLLPVNAWGTSYVTAVPAGGRASGAPFVDLIATEDDTVVTLSPKSTALEGGDVILPVKVGQSMKLPIPRGQAYHLVQGVDLTGTVLSANKPFLAVAGSRCWGNPCDSAHQQLPSVATLGWEYAAVGHRDRLAAGPAADACAPKVPETHAFRIVGVANGTTLTYEPEAPAGAPVTLDVGKDAWISSVEPFVVRSQDDEHPFLLMELMSSCSSVDPCNKYGCPGDPEFTTSVPSAQFLRDYLFFTDPTYPTTHLVVVRQRGGGGTFAPVSLDCMGEIDGWSSLGRDYEYTRVDLVTDGVSQSGCANGRHTMTSEAPFAVTIWGWGSGETGATSYAYPASRGVRPVSPIDVK